MITKDMLKTKSFYLKAKLLNRSRRGDPRLKSTKKMVDMVLNLNLKAIQHEKPITLTTIWSPSEILYALDCIPICAETTASSVASYGLGDDFLTIAEKHFHSPETCSFLRCATGAVMDNLFPQPAAVIASTHLCDAGAKMISYASQVYDCEYFLIDIPQEKSEEAVDYVTRQLEEMAQRLSELTGRRLSKEKLAKAIERSNEARRYALRANELRQSIPAPMRGSEALSYLYLPGIGFGSKETAEIYRKMAEELEKRVKKKFSPLGEERHRLLWLHVKPYFPNRLFRYLEKERKASIAFEEVNYIFWPELDPEQPFKSVAQKLIANLAHGSMDSYLEILLELVKKYKINGVVHFAHWGCRWNYGRIKIIKEALQEKSIPFLSLDCDSIASSDYFEGQLNSRIDTFLDMLS